MVLKNGTGQNEIPYDKARVCKRSAPADSEASWQIAVTYNHDCPGFGGHPVFAIVHWDAIHIIASTMGCRLLHVSQRRVAIALVMLNMSMGRSLLMVLHVMQDVHSQYVRHDEGVGWKKQEYQRETATMQKEVYSLKTKK